MTSSLFIMWIVQTLPILRINTPLVSMKSLGLPIACPKKSKKKKKEKDYYAMPSPYPYGEIYALSDIENPF